MISAVIFDFDGTILDTEWSEFSSVRDEYRRHGLDYRLEDFVGRVGRADNPHWSLELQERLGRPIDLETITERRRLDHAERIAATELRPGVAELVDRLHGADVPIGVASSSPSSWVERHLNERGLIDRFGTITTRDHVERGKPWPDLFLTAAERLDVAPEQCLAIEDSFHGVTAALAAGMRCVAFPNPVTVHSDLSQAELILDSLHDLPHERFGLA